MKKSFREWLKARECAVPYVGQKVDRGGEMSWQGAAGKGKLHSAKGEVKTK